MTAVQGAERDGPCELEVKHGIVQIAETLHFMHKSCNLAHCNLSPESIMIAADGSWKLAGFAFATPISPNGAKQLHLVACPRMNLLAASSLTNKWHATHSIERSKSKCHDFQVP